VEHTTFYRTTQIDGLAIIYREAGPKDAPTLLLLHGLPSSSRMFEPLFARLSDHYHLVAPRLSGLRTQRLAGPEKSRVYVRPLRGDHKSLHRNPRALALHTLYAGLCGPVGFRMALVHPDRIVALVVQDAVAHNEGLEANWQPRRAFWAYRAVNESALRKISSRCLRRGRAMSGTIPMRNAMPRISGPMNLPCSTSRARPTFKATSSTTIEPMWTLTRNGRHGCARGSRAC
jgi:pimeloyl-ACP methyl ester carboxylesterase